MTASDTGQQEQETAAAGGQTQSPEGAASPTVESVLRDKDELKNILVRTQADFSNYRKRMEQEREEARRMVAAGIIVVLLPALDDLDRTMANMPPAVAQSPWGEGLGLAQRKLQSVLEGAGLKPIEAEGKTFDPWEHEAVMYDETGEHAEGTVVHVVRAGYKLQGRVLRPAQVVVARRPVKAEETAPDTHNETRGG